VLLALSSCAAILLGYDGLQNPRPADVPPNATLVFDVELIDVVPESAPPDQ
jgi:hypothetical protein